MQHKVNVDRYVCLYYYDYLASNVVLASAFRTYLPPPQTINYQCCAKQMLQNTTGEVCWKPLSYSKRNWNK